MKQKVEKRLKKSNEFRKVYRNGRAVVSKNIVLYYCPNDLPFNRLGFSISKKVGKSVIRNRIRRIFREAYINMEEQLLKGYDFIIVGRKPSAGVSFHEAGKELFRLCRKARLTSNQEMK